MEPQKVAAPPGGVVLYELREVHLRQIGGRYAVNVDKEPDAGGEYDNPLEAWARFADLIDARVRRRIGDLLENRARTDIPEFERKGVAKMAKKIDSG